MANTIDAPDANGGDSAPAGPPSGGAPPGGPPSGQPGGKPPGGGPMLAALMRQQQGAQQSAPGPGAQADALTKLGGAMKLLEAALPGLTGHPAYKDALKALTSLQKHGVQGSPGSGVQKTMFSDMLQSTVRNALLQKLAGQQGGQPGQPDQPQQAPSPSMPLPGA